MYNFKSYALVQDRKPESPAFTLLFDLGISDKSPIDIDLVPAIRIDGWPKTAREIHPSKWIEKSTAEKAMQCFHVVTKRFPEGILLSSSVRLETFRMIWKKMILLDKS